jgi:hypothetical protein
MFTATMEIFALIAHLVTALVRVAPPPRPVAFVP